MEYIIPVVYLDGGNGSSESSKGDEKEKDWNGLKGW